MWKFYYFIILTIHQPFGWMMMAVTVKGDVFYSYKSPKNLHNSFTPLLQMFFFNFNHPFMVTATITQLKL